MTPTWRFLFATLVAGCLVAAVCCWQPAWAEAVGLDLWNLPELEARLAAEEQRYAELGESSRVVLERSARKQQVVDAVMEGRLGLLEAAARFRDLTPAEGPPLHYLRRAYPGASDDERFCREVLTWVRGAVAERPLAERRGRLTRLEMELDEQLHRDGPLTLPR